MFKARTYQEYKKTRKASKYSKTGDVVGMTLHGAVINIGLRGSGFTPGVVLVDEAGQIPLVVGVAVGLMNSPSVVFIGDDRQMPPIFHPELSNHKLSTSIFTYCATKFPNLKTVLDLTYRMNTEITDCVSNNFYMPFGISLKSYKEPIFAKSIEIYSYPSKGLNYEDYNPEEANDVVEEVLKYTKDGFSVSVITPFRKQVNCIRLYCQDRYKKAGMENEVPLIDTVERLQGQSVDVILISFSVDSLSYFNKNRTFLLDNHRLNVMISRAKQKVVIFKSDIVDLRL